MGEVKAPDVTRPKIPERMKVKIEEMYRITGRGWVLCVWDSRLKERNVVSGSTVTAGGKAFTVSAVERSGYGNGRYSPLAGIILRPNDQVEECFHVGQEIEIETTESKRED